MNYSDEFSTVDLIINSSAKTRGVDAFALSLIKTERQIRKLFTYLIFQYPCFATTDVPNLRETLAQSRKVYFEGFIKGFNTIYPKTIESLISTESYANLLDKIKEAITYRNKIFHGQVTNRYLKRDDLLKLVGSTRQWCERLANGAMAELGYDGFGRNSYQKSKEHLWKRYNIEITNIEEYKKFIKTYMERNN